MLRFILLVFAFTISTKSFSKIYMIPDNIDKGDKKMKCVETSEDTVEQAIANLKKEMPFCRETKETFVNGNFLVICKHPTDTFKSKLVFFSISKENCEAQLVHANTNIVPKGFEKPKKIK